MNIRPFRGYRYGIGRARDVSKVVAPPYDQIGPETQAHLYAMSPENIVRVTLPRAEVEPPPGGRGEAPTAGPVDKYARARDVLDTWLGQGVWAPEEAPAIYPYHQTYTVGGTPITRKGFVALGEVTDYGRGVVLPHERTHTGPKQDRMALLEATGADIGLLFMLVGDPSGELLRATTPPGPPVAEARDLKGEHHVLWRVTDAQTVARVQALVAGRQVIIADGHHRYETAVEYRRRHPEATHKLMAFFALEAPGLTILPNHRLVHGVSGWSFDRLCSAAREWFDVRPLPEPAAFRPTNREIGVVSGGEAAVFSLPDAAHGRVPWPAGTSPAWRRLAVSILHEALLKPWLDITDARLDAGTHVEYTADQAEAVALARAGRYQAAFLIAPTTPAELQEVVRGGELLPQKSTHFYPKLLDGLVFHRLAG
jgi:uncharacterized protein (DUF1015 family)